MNPQAMANADDRKKVYTGDVRLGSQVDTDTWLTPRFVLSQLGEFDLDPCAAACNPGWTGAKKSITKAENGLECAWVGRVFMNPPFSRTASWLAAHAEHGNGISLVAASVESGVWHKYVWTSAKGILLLRGRTRFCNPDGTTTTGKPLRSIALIAWTEYDASVLFRSDLAGVMLSNWVRR